MGNRWTGSDEPPPGDGRTCVTCKELKATDQYGRTGTGRLRGQCNPCRSHIERERYLSKRDEILIQQKAYAEANRDKLTAAKRARRQDVIARRAEIRKLYRAEVLAAYGPQCNCCGEMEEAFLQVDHVNDDGNLHRNIVNPSDLYRWLSRNNFPAGFQILCANCNHAKAVRGQCPHTLSRGDGAILSGDLGDQESNNPSTDRVEEIIEGNARKG